MASTAEALYTITTLEHTSSSVARNSTLSDFSFRAIVTCPGPGSDGALQLCRHRCREDSERRASGQQSSVSRRVGTPASQAGAACVPSSQLLTAAGRLTTVHRSRFALLLRQLRAPPRLNTRRAPRSRGTCRSSRTPAPAPPCHPAGASSNARRTAAGNVAASWTGTAPSSASWISGAASPIATTPALSRAQRLAEQLKSPLLNRPPMITTRPSIEALDRLLRGFDVRRLRIVDKAHAADRGHRLERVLEARERFDRAAPSRRAGTPAILATVAAAMTSADTGAGRSAGSTTAAPAAVSTEKDHLSRASRARQRKRLRIVGVDHRPVVCRLVRENPRLRRAVRPPSIRGGRDGLTTSSAARQSTDETSRSSRAESCSPRRCETCPASSRPPESSTACRCFRRPRALNPPASNMRPVSVVVVDLPFVPVIATIRPLSQRDASSISPMTGTPALRAAAIGGWSSGTPGLNTIRSADVTSRAGARRARARRRACAKLSSRLGVELRPRVGQRDARAALGEQQRSRNAAAGSADDGRRSVPGRKMLIAVSTSSG